jgi:signal transduction histidine kinase
VSGKARPTLRSLFNSEARKWAATGFAFAFGLSLSLVIWLAKRAAEERAEGIATAASMALHETLVLGDVRGFELRARRAFHLGPRETIQALGSDLKPILPGEKSPEMGGCGPVGACWSAGYGNVATVVPVYFDAQSKSLFGYVYARVEPKVDWAFAGGFGLAILCGFLVQSCGLIYRMLAATTELSKRMASWADQLKRDPKGKDEFQGEPFAELMPVREALIGLGDEIQRLEDRARDDGKLIVLRGIAHDILNPVMQLMRNFGTFELQQKQGAPADPDLVADMKASMTRLCAVATQVKSVRENESAAKLLAQADLGAEVAALIRSLRRDGAIASRGVALKLASAPVTAPCRAEPVDVQRIVENLVRNSVSASRSGQSVEIEVKVEAGTPTLYVRDSGCGMNAETMGRAFEAEFTTRPESGSGLGLSIVKALCDMHGAKVEFESQPGRGSEFRVRFKSA